MPRRRSHAIATSAVDSATSAIVFVAQGSTLPNGHGDRTASATRTTRASFDPGAAFLSAGSGLSPGSLLCGVIEAEPPPALEQELPEGPSPAKISLQLRPGGGHLFGSRESPDVGVARLAKNRAEQAAPGAR